MNQSKKDKDPCYAKPSSDSQLSFLITFGGPNVSRRLSSNCEVSGSHPGKKAIERCSEKNETCSVM